MKRNFFDPTSARGYSLAELMTVLAITGILASQALPDMSQLYQRAQASHISNQLIQLVQFSRSKAVETKAMIALCPSKSGQSCSKQWQHGIIIFVDQDENGKRDNAEEILLFSDPLPPGSWLDWRAFGNRNYLQYNALGYTDHQNGRFAYCPAKGGNRFAQQIIINKAGRPRKAGAKELKLKYCQG